MLNSRERELWVWWASAEWTRAWPAGVWGQWTLQKRQAASLFFSPLPLFFQQPHCLNLVPTEEGVGWGAIQEDGQRSEAASAPDRPFLGMGICQPSTLSEEKLTHS